MNHWLQAALIASPYGAILLPAVLLGIFLVHHNRFKKLKPKDARIARRVIYITWGVFWVAFFIKLSVIDHYP